MQTARLFIGGLSEKVNRQELGTRLSHYASTISIEIKEKLDQEGNISSRFAYANVEAPSSSSIEQCIRELDGASWKGSRLRVERAKESFMERLNRERASINKQEKEESSTEKLSNEAVTHKQQNVTESEGSRELTGHDTLAEETRKRKDKKLSKKRKHHTNEDESSPKKESTSPGDDEGVMISDDLPSPKKKKKKKNEVEENMLSSFKKFSSFWADSDNEQDNEEKESSLAVTKQDETARQETVPSSEETTKYVKMAKDLSFGQNSGFSLLAHFSRTSQEGEEEEATSAAPLNIVKPTTSTSQKVKPPFFFTCDDPRIKNAITWITTPITEEVIETFEEGLPEVREAIKAFSVKAKRNEDDPRGARRGRGGRGRGRGRGRGYSRGRAAGGVIRHS